MNAKQIVSKKKWKVCGYLSIFISIVSILLLLVSCSEVDAKHPIPTLTTEVSCPPLMEGDGAYTPVPNMPDSFARLWPGPEEQLDLMCYQEAGKRLSPIQRGVGTTLRVAEIDLDLLHEPPIPVYMRTRLYVDGDLVPQETFTFADCLIEIIVVDDNGTPQPTGRSGCYYVSWTPELGVGTHEAKIEVTRDNGEIIEYTWSFTLR